MKRKYEEEDYKTFKISKYDLNEVIFDIKIFCFDEDNIKKEFKLDKYKLDLIKSGVNFNKDSLFKINNLIIEGKYPVNIR